MRRLLRNKSSRARSRREIISRVLAQRNEKLGAEESMNNEGGEASAAWRPGTALRRVRPGPGSSWQLAVGEPAPRGLPHGLSSVSRHHLHVRWSALLCLWIGFFLLFFLWLLTAFVNKTFAKELDGFRPSLVPLTALPSGNIYFIAIGM